MKIKAQKKDHMKNDITGIGLFDVAVRLEQHKIDTFFDSSPNYLIPHNLSIGRRPKMVQASINQSFLNAPKRDHHLLSIIMCFVAYANIAVNSEAVLQCTSINEILIKGHAEFLKVRGTPKFNRSHIDYIKSIVLKSYRITFLMADRKLVGQLKTTHSKVFNIYSGLTAVLKEYAGCIFMCANTTMLIGQTGKMFYVFDPHGRTSNFRRNPTQGMAAFILLESIENVVHLILNLSSFRNSEMFSLVATQIESIIKCQEQMSCCHSISSDVNCNFWKLRGSPYNEVAKLTSAADSMESLISMSPTFQSCENSTPNSPRDLNDEPNLVYLEAKSGCGSECSFDSESSESWADALDTNAAKNNYFGLNEFNTHSNKVDINSGHELDTKVDLGKGDYEVRRRDDFYNVQDSIWGLDLVQNFGIRDAFSNTGRLYKGFTNTYIESRTIELEETNLLAKNTKLPPSRYKSFDRRRKVDPKVNTQWKFGSSDVGRQRWKV